MIWISHHSTKYWRFVGGCLSAISLPKKFTPYKQRHWVEIIFLYSQTEVVWENFKSSYPMDKGCVFSFYFCLTIHHLPDESELYPNRTLWEALRTDLPKLYEQAYRLVYSHQQIHRNHAKESTSKCNITHKVWKTPLWVLRNWVFLLVLYWFSFALS